LRTPIRLTKVKQAVQSKRLPASNQQQQMFEFHIRQRIYGMISSQNRGCGRDGTIAFSIAGQHAVRHGNGYVQDSPAENVQHGVSSIGNSTEVKRDTNQSCCTGKLTFPRYPQNQ
jgi:hypothetical protein